MTPEIITALATAAATTVSMLATETGKEMAKKTGGALWDKLTQIIRRKPKPAEALNELIKAPKDEDAQAALRLQIRKAAEEDPAFASELHALLPEMQALTQSFTQNATIRGDGNKTVQNAGSGNDISIS